MVDFYETGNKTLKKKTQNCHIVLLYSLLPLRLGLFPDERFAAGPVCPRSAQLGPPDRSAPQTQRLVWRSIEERHLKEWETPNELTRVQSCSEKPGSENTTVMDAWKEVSKAPSRFSQIKSIMSGSTCAHRRWRHLTTDLKKKPLRPRKEWRRFHWDDPKEPWRSRTTP